MCVDHLPNCAMGLRPAESVLREQEKLTCRTADMILQYKYLSFLNVLYILVDTLTQKDQYISTYKTEDKIESC